MKTNNKNILKYEIDGLIETAQVIVQLDGMIKELEEDELEKKEQLVHELEVLMADFQRRCFRLFPIVKRHSKTHPEYKDLLVKLKECIKTLGSEEAKIS